MIRPGLDHWYPRDNVATAFPLRCIFIDVTNRGILLGHVEETAKRALDVLVSYGDVVPIAELHERRVEVPLSYGLDVVQTERLAAIYESILKDVNETARHPSGIQNSHVTRLLRRRPPRY